MKGALALRKPAIQGAAAVIDTSGTNITNAAYVQLITGANMLKAASGIIVTNGGSQPLQLAAGAAASEQDTGVIIPLVVDRSLSRLNLKPVFGSH